MVVVTVFRHVPRPITGMIGVLYDRAFEAFEANLDWLETTGILVERFDPSTAPSEMATRPVVQQLLSADGNSSLPLILVNDAVVSQGGYLSRTQLARAVGSVRDGVPQAVARQLAAIGAAAASAAMTKYSKVEDIQDIMRYGIMSTPGVVIEGQVVHAGGVPSRSKVDGWLAGVAAS